MPDFMLGLAIGFASTLCLWNICANRTHRWWMKLCDRYEAMIESLLQERDDADWWKQK